jgi:hypothetical protein
MSNYLLKKCLSKSRAAGCKCLRGASSLALLACSSFLWAGAPAEVETTAEGGGKPAFVAGNAGVQAPVVAGPLLTRSFRLNLSMFAASSEAQVRKAGESPLEHEALRIFFAKAGVQLTDDRVFYNDRTSVLMVRATEHELSLIESALKEVKPLPFVKVEVKYAALSDAALEEWNELWRVAYYEKHVNMEPYLPRWRECATAILIESEAAKLMKKLEGKEGVEMILPGSVTTLSGKQARISLEDEEPVLIPPFHAPRKRPVPQGAAP